MISSGVSAVVSAPWKKSAAWITCAPDFPTTAISASQVTAIPGISAAGSAWATLPPDRAAIADLIVRDMRDRGLEQRMRGLEPLVVFDVAPAHHGAERHALLRNPDAAQIGELAKIDEQRGLGEPEGEHRHEALAARDRLGVAVARGEELDGFRKRCRAGIVEGRQFHDLDASFALHAT